MKHSIHTTATAPTGPVKIDFIWLSLKPDRGNQVICSPTSSPLLVAAVVPNSCKIQPAEKQTCLKVGPGPAWKGETGKKMENLGRPRRGKGREVVSSRPPVWTEPRAAYAVLCLPVCFLRRKFAILLSCHLLLT